MWAIGWLFIVFGVVFFGGSMGFYIADMKVYDPAQVSVHLLPVVCRKVTEALLVTRGR